MPVIRQANRFVMHIRSVLGEKFESFFFLSRKREIVLFCQVDRHAPQGTRAVLIDRFDRLTCDPSRSLKEKLRLDQSGALTGAGIR